MPRLLSVNVSLPKEIQVKGKTVRTGIFKEPVAGKVMARRLNLEGDGQADLLAHGGEQRAVYVYSYDNYPYWSRELGRDDFQFGQFGENFTIDTMPDDQVHVGDRFQIGTALFEVTQPRVPCYKLAIKMRSDDFYARMLESGRLGFYFRVLREGEVSAGDEVERVHFDPIGMSISEMNALMYFDKDDQERMSKAMRIEALSPGWKAVFEERLAKAKIAPSESDPYRKLVVQKKVVESEHITSFYLASPDGTALPTFLPGQFLPLRLNIPGQFKSIKRTYSLSDRPSAGHYRLSIKREPAPADSPDAYPGVASNYFHDQVEVGTELMAKKPRGEFVLDIGESTPVVLLSAGVGQTPMISMLNEIAATGSERQVWFIHGARNGKQHAFGNHVRRLAASTPNVNAHVRYSQPTTNDVRGSDYDSQGYVDVELVQQLVSETVGDFYLCGPTTFMESVYAGLRDWGVDANRIHYEFFGQASPLQQQGFSTAKPTAEVGEGRDEKEVVFSRSGVTTNWIASSGSLLDLAEANGLTPDYSCRSGICGTCQRQLKSGTVEYLQEPLDTPDDGTVLICCAKPTTDVVIDI